MPVKGAMPCYFQVSMCMWMVYWIYTGISLRATQALIWTTRCSWLPMGLQPCMPASWMVSICLTCQRSWWRHQMETISASWWRHQMETISALLAFSAVNSPVTGEFTSQRASDAELWCFLICAWIKSANNGDDGEIRRHRAHYDVTIMGVLLLFSTRDINVNISLCNICLFTQG